MLVSLALVSSFSFSSFVTEIGVLKNLIFFIVVIVTSRTLCKPFCSLVERLIHKLVVEILSFSIQFSF